jgi:hypothetical protein
MQRNFGSRFCYKVKAKIVEYDPKEEKIKRDTFEKKAKREQEAIYTKQKLENEKELEKKKKQFIQNISKKSFTFDFEGKIMFLKPSREDNIAINEFTEPGVNSKKTLMKNVNPAETNPKVKIAEIIEREGGEKTSYTQTTKNPEDEKSKKPVGNNAGSKIPAFFRPAPNLIDIVQLASGVILTTGRNQIKKGAVNKQELKPKLEEFRIKHRQGEQAPVLEDTEQRNKREEEKKLNKEKKYRRTIDDWKDELKKGLSSNIDFDPELLINLIMTDDDEKARERKQRRREEREIKIRNFQEVKVRMSVISLEEDRGDRCPP